jgi:hypothetical protein
MAERLTARRKKQQAVTERLFFSFFLDEGEFISPFFV